MTEFDFFVIQVPKAPFGVSWYQGDIETDKNGRGHQQFVGRFSIETFAVAPGSAPAPVVFNGPFPDASLNPPFNPIQMYHLGLWFGSPQAAQAAGCPASVTPFNGEHNAGTQVLNTANFPRRPWSVAEPQRLSPETVRIEPLALTMALNSATIDRAPPAGVARCASLRAGG